MSGPRPTPLTDPDRLAALARVEIEDPRLRAALDRLASVLARALDAPVAQVNLVTERERLPIGHSGDPDWRRPTPVGAGYCELVSAAGEPMVVADTRVDPLLKDLPATRSGVAAYLGAPLTLSTGHVLGSVCVADVEPRVWTQTQVDTALEIAGAAAAEIERAATHAALVRSEALFRSIQASSPSGFVLLEAVGDVRREAVDFRCAYVNPEGERILGRPAEQLLGRSFQEFCPGNEVEERRSRYHAAFSTGVPERFEVRSPGEAGDRWFEVTVARVDGGVGVTFVEITERKRGETVQRYLSEAGRVLAQSLDLEETLRRLVELAVPDLADWCAVDLRTPEGEIRRAAVAHTEPDRRAIAEELVRRHPYRLDEETGIGAVIRTCRPEWAPEISDELLERAPMDPEAREMLHALGLRSYVIVPLQSRGECFGALTLVQADSGRRFGERDLDVARELAGRASAAITNARLFDEAVRARAEADEASRVKSQFLANMSHEIRTPINAVVGYLDLLEMQVAGPLTEQQAQFLARVRTSSHHLLTLINDVLDLAKVEAGDLQVRREEVGVSTAVREALDIASPLIASRGLRLAEAPACSDHLRLRGDPDRVRQILVNLLSNAAKFTESGEIRVRCRVAQDWPGLEPSTRAGWVLIEVEDTGVGIPEEMQERVFEPFVQVSGAYSRPVGGTGLGLPISRRLARLMGGELSLASSPGAGSRFTLALPAVDPHDTALPERRHRQDRQDRRGTVPDRRSGSDRRSGGPVDGSS